MSHFKRTHKFQKKSTKIFTICRIKLDVKKYVSVTAITKLMPANLSKLIIIKFIKANNKGFKKLGSSHFLIILCIPSELLYLTSKGFLFVYLFPCLFAWKKNQNGTWIFLLKIPFIKQSRDLIG